MLNTFWELHFGRGLELLLAKTLRIRELEIQCCPIQVLNTEGFKNSICKTTLKYLRRIHSHTPEGSLCVFREVEDSLCFLMATHPPVKLLSQLPMQLLFIHILTGESQKCEAWSKLSVFCKAEVCFSAQSLIAQK